MNRILLLLTILLLSGCPTVNTSKIFLTCNGFPGTPVNTIVVNKYMECTASVGDAKGIITPQPVINFKSSNPNIATISENGTLAAINVGTVTINASSGILETDLKIEVIQKASGLVVITDIVGTNTFADFKPNESIIYDNVPNLRNVSLFDTRYNNKRKLYKTTGLGFRLPLDALSLNFVDFDLGVNSNSAIFMSYSDTTANNLDGNASVLNWNCTKGVLQFKSLTSNFYTFEAKNITCFGSGQISSFDSITLNGEFVAYGN